MGSLRSMQPDLGFAAEKAIASATTDRKDKEDRRRPNATSNPRTQV